jgi:hypothetical protein
LTLRKARRAVSRSAAASLRLSLADAGPADSVQVSRLESGPGIFWFQTEGHSAFVGTAVNLRLQIDVFLAALGPYIVPEWMEPARSVCRLFTSAMPQSKEEEREDCRSILLRQSGSRLNFFTNSLFAA